jgi:hypothetical protein
VGLSPSRRGCGSVEPIQKKARDRLAPRPAKATAKKPDLLPPCTTANVRIRCSLGKVWGIHWKSGNGEQVEVPSCGAGTPQDSASYSSASGCCVGSTKLGAAQFPARAVPTVLN